MLRYLETAFAAGSGEGFRLKNVRGHFDALYYFGSLSGSEHLTWRYFEQLVHWPSGPGTCGQTGRTLHWYQPMLVALWIVNQLVKDIWNLT